jgi:hypothetical protein
VHIQFRFGGEGGLLMGVEVRWERNLKCNVTFGEDLRNPAYRQLFSAERITEVSILSICSRSAPME